MWTTRQRVGQAATHTPRPMHAAASKAASATGFGTSVTLASSAARGWR